MISVGKVRKINLKVSLKQRGKVRITLVKAMGGVEFAKEALRMMKEAKLEKLKRVLLRKKGIFDDSARASYAEVRGHGSLRLRCKECNIVYCRLRWDRYKVYYCDCGRALNPIMVPAFKRMK